jgi:hypothetical protein
VAGPRAVRWLCPMACWDGRGADSSSDQAFEQTRDVPLLPWEHGYTRLSERCGNRRHRRARPDAIAVHHLSEGPDHRVSPNIQDVVTGPVEEEPRSDRILARCHAVLNLSPAIEGSAPPPEGIAVGFYRVLANEQGTSPKGQLRERAADEAVSGPAQPRTVALGASDPCGQEEGSTGPNDSEHLELEHRWIRVPRVLVEAAHEFVDDRGERWCSPHKCASLEEEVERPNIPAPQRRDVHTNGVVPVGAWFSHQVRGEDLTHRNIDFRGVAPHAEVVTSDPDRARHRPA